MTPDTRLFLRPRHVALPTPAAVSLALLTGCAQPAAPEQLEKSGRTSSSWASPLQTTALITRPAIPGQVPVCPTPSD